MSGLRIGLAGSGFMGRAHALAFTNVGAVFDLPDRPVLELIADRDEATAELARASLGFARATADWRLMVADPAVDAVAIATPNILHAPIALAAIAVGKPVYCEKPLAATLAEALAMTEAAEAAGVATQVGFTYLHNPMVAYARALIASGEIGEVTTVRVIHAEDFMASPQAPYGWRCEPDNAGGALADIGSHAIAMARFLAGDIASVSASLRTVHATRPGPTGAPLPVHVDDTADATVIFASGAAGTISASWIESGRLMGLGFEISGTKGGLSFRQERFNELRLFRAGGRGFTLLEAGPDHPPYGAFCPAPGHQLGYGDLKTIEVRAFLAAVAGEASGFGFREAYEVDRVADAMRRSSAERKWINL